MQPPVRYYIVQADEQPVVRSVPVVRPAAAAPAAAEPVRVPRPHRPAAVKATGVSRLVRAAIARRDRDR